MGSLYIFLSTTLIATFFIWLSYLILFKEERERGHLANNAHLGIVGPKSGRITRVMNFLLGFPLYVLIVGVPFFVLVTFLPVILSVNQEDITAQDLFLGRYLSGKHQAHLSRFGKLPTLLTQLATAGDDMHSPAWVKAREYVTHELGGSRRFGHDVWQALIDWGKTLLAQHNESNHPITDAAAARAALARLAGTDNLPERLEQLNQRIARLPAAQRLGSTDPVADYLTHAMMLHVFYPNDDVAYLEILSHELNLNRQRGASSLEALAQLLIFMTSSDPLLVFFMIVVFGLLVHRGMKLVTIRFLGWVLHLREKTLYREFAEDAFHPRRFLACFIPLLIITWILSFIFMESFYVLWWPDDKWILYLACGLWNTLIGGVLVESLGNVASLILIRAGYDPLRIYWDNLVVAFVSVVILRYFQNSWFVITTGLTLGVLQSAVQKIMAHRKHPLQ